jgi:hypothetical protein
LSGRIPGEIDGFFRDFGAFALLDAIRQGDVRAARERTELHMNNDIQRGLVNFGAP